MSYHSVQTTGEHRIKKNNAVVRLHSGVEPYLMDKVCVTVILIIKYFAYFC